MMNMPDATNFLMSDADWNFLLGRIKAGRCTPFLGAGASSDLYPLGSQLAKEWATQYQYPLDDAYDLARVAQFVAVTEDRMTPKDKIQEKFDEIQLPDFASPSDPHHILAALPFPIYITTNYDDSMIKALQARQKDPKLELCRWNSTVRENEKSVFDVDKNYVPTPANPLVFHLHGHYKVPESLVLTEDDYLDFLINITRDEELLPLCVRGAMTRSTLLFLGYKIADWDFRVLFRRIVGYLTISQGRRHISIQLAPEHEGIPKEKQEKVQRYLEDYYSSDKVRVYWGKYRDFTEELRIRWEDFNNGN
jgi:SIR2-like protein